MCRSLRLREALLVVDLQDVLLVDMPRDCSDHEDSPKVSMGSTKAKEDKLVLQQNLHAPNRTR